MPSRSKPVDALLAEMKPWPKSWRYDDQDIPPGARLIADFAPFVRHLHADGMAPGTLNYPVLKDRDSQFIAPLTRRLPGLKPQFLRPECCMQHCSQLGHDDHMRHSRTPLATCGFLKPCVHTANTVGWCDGETPQ